MIDLLIKPQTLLWVVVAATTAVAVPVQTTVVVVVVVTRAAEAEVTQAEAEEVAANKLTSFSSIKYKYKYPIFIEMIFWHFPQEDCSRRFRFQLSYRGAFVCLDDNIPYHHLYTYFPFPLIAIDLHDERYDIPHSQVGFFVSRIPEEELEFGFFGYRYR